MAAIVRRAAPPGDGAHRRGRTSFWRGSRHWLRRTVLQPPDWPREYGCRRPTRARRGERLSHAPPVADRRRLATGIPHYSSTDMIRLVRRLAMMGSGGGGQTRTALT